MQLLPKTKTLAMVLAVVALGSTACVKQNAPGVGLVKFESSAVFGITPKEAPVVPDFNVPEDLSAIPDVNPPTRLTPKLPEGPCPDAKLTAFPKKSATVKVDGVPDAGVYKWKRPLFTLKDASVDPPKLINTPLSFENRAIRRIVKDGDHQFNFEMLAPDAFAPGSTVITSFHVNTNEQLFVDRRVDSRTIGVVNIPGTDVRVANPADAPGIFITGIEVQDSKGTQVSSFSPVQPMLILPLEGGLVRTGQQFRSVGIDGSSGTAVVNDGVTGRTSRIDACGEIVEGYVVTLHQTLTSDVDMDDPIGAGANLGTRQETREITYTFATQYGAMPIGESLSIGDIAVDTIAALAKWELGGLTPTALPDSLK